MRQTPDIQRLMKDPLYGEARKFLDALLEGSLPPADVTARLYGDRRTGIVLRVARSYLDANREKFGRRRPHRHDATDLIARRRLETESDPDFQEIHSRLLVLELPALPFMERFYGSYAETILNIYQLYIAAELNRKCGLSATAHLHRVAAIARALPLDDAGSGKYTAVAALHDVLEDLLTLNPKPNRKPFQLAEYNRFVDTYLPEDLREGVRMLTNHYDLVLHLVLLQLKREGHYPNKKNLRRSIHGLRAPLGETFASYLRDLEEVIDSTPAEGEDQDVFSRVKWECYKTHYISRLGADVHEKDDYRLFEIKAIDLSDNGHGRDALAADSRIKNIIKHQVFANTCASLHSNWHALNARWEELQEDALVHAEHMIIASLLNQESALDFVMSGMKNLVRMGSVFFVDVPA